VDAARRGKLEAFQREEAANIALFAREAEAAESSAESQEVPREG
jgi:hypothetical protein